MSDCLGKYLMHSESVRTECFLLLLDGKSVKCVVNVNDETDDLIICLVFLHYPIQ